MNTWTTTRRQRRSSTRSTGSWVLSIAGWAAAERRLRRFDELSREWQPGEHIEVLDVASGGGDVARGAGPLGSRAWLRPQRDGA